MKREKTVELTKQLNEMVEGFKNTNNYINYLRFASSKRQYSDINCMLLYMQNPRVSIVRGMKTWNKFGRRVNKGEKALYIFAPIIHKVEDEETNEEEDVLCGFRPVPVFDISQTSGKDIPTASSLVKTLEGDIEDFDVIVEKLRKATTATITFDDEEASEKGYYNSEENRIVVHRNGNSKFQQLKTLCHEIAHSILHNKQAEELTTFSRNVKECEAESTAYIVLHSLGYNTEDYSLGYLAGWEGQETDLIKKSISRISKCADKILDVIQPEETANA